MLPGAGDVAPGQYGQRRACGDEGFGDEDAVAILGLRDNLSGVWMRGADHKVGGVARHAAREHVFCASLENDPRVVCLHTQMRAENDGVVGAV